MESTDDKTWLIEHAGLSHTYIQEEEILSQTRAKQISDVMPVSNPRVPLCTVFTTGGSVEYMYFGLSAMTDVLDVSRIFPNGALSVRVTGIPGTSFKLQNDYRIIVSRGIASAPVNASLRRIFGVTWTGNLLVSKYTPDGAHTDMMYEDTEIVMLLIGSWVKNMLHIRQDFTQSSTS